MTNSNESRVTMLRLSQIIPGYNPRRYFDQKKHDELVASFRLRGVLQAVLVRPAHDLADTFQLVAGERRHRAGLEAFGPDGLIPATIREMTDQESLEAAIDENDIRDDVSETEQADAAVRALAASQGDRTEAAARLGWSRSKLDRRLALADLSKVVKTALDERRIKIGHAELLAAIPADKQEKALETILGVGLDVAKTRELLMRVVQDLGAAEFDKSECTTCPFNSASQRALFETHVDDGHCTNPPCFQLKAEAMDRAREESEQRTAEVAAETPKVEDGAENDDDDDGEELSLSPTSDDLPAKPVTQREPQPAAAAAKGGAGITAKSIAAKMREVREAAWRTALARALAGNADHARIAVLVAAMSGTLSQIQPTTLTARAGLLVAATFPSLNYPAKILAIQALPDNKATDVMSAIGAAYARDVSDFAHVGYLAITFDVDLRESWVVDQPFLERFTKDELRFIAWECGFVSHKGEKSFGKLLASKKPELIAGMLNATGFNWAGRLPSAMTLDGKYGPPAAAIQPAASPIVDLAA